MSTTLPVQLETQIRHKTLKIPTAKNTKETSYVAQTKEAVVGKREINNNEEKSSVAEYKRQIVWFNAIGFLILHLAAAYSLYLSFTKAKFLTNVWSKF